MHVNILGTRGIPAGHGGFETFAERLALYLVERQWTVSVYCQGPAGAAGAIATDDWHGVERIIIPTRTDGVAGTMEFDWRTIAHVGGRPGCDLVLGYNTALFCLRQRLAGRRLLMNMDGIEWQRAKWSFAAKAWFWLNELVGANIATQAIADHPEMARHAEGRSRTTPVMIPYGADRIDAAPTGPVTAPGLIPDNYLISIARVEPENSILEIVRAFGSERRGASLAVLGNFADDNAYHRAVRAAASDEVVFPGAIYDRDAVAALRFHARGYVHGHQVGGTNPSLVEALGAGNAVIAHDNRFNRWTAGPDQAYFSTEAECAAAIARSLHDDPWLTDARAGARRRHAADFQWDHVLAQYEALLERFA